MKYDLATFAWRFGLRFQDDGGGDGSPGSAQGQGGGPGGTSTSVGTADAPGGYGSPGGQDATAVGGQNAPGATDGTTDGLGGMSVSGDTSAQGQGGLSGYSVRGVNAPMGNAPSPAGQSPGSQAGMTAAAGLGLGTGGGLGGVGGVGASPGLGPTGAGFSTTGNYGQAFGQSGVNANFGRGGPGSTGLLGLASQMGVPSLPGIRGPAPAPAQSPALSQLALQLFHLLFAPTLSGFPAGAPGSAVGPGTAFGFPAAAPTIGGVVGQPSSIQATPGSQLGPLGIAGPLGLGEGDPGPGPGGIAVGTPGADDTGQRGGTSGPGESTDTGIRGGTDGDTTQAPTDNTDAPISPDEVDRAFQKAAQETETLPRPATLGAPTPGWPGIPPGMVTGPGIDRSLETPGWPTTEFNIFHNAPFTPQQINNILKQILGSTTASPALAQLAMALAMGGA